MKKILIVTTIAIIIIAVILVWRQTYIDNYHKRPFTVLVDELVTITPDDQAPYLDPWGMEHWNFKLESNTKLTGNIHCFVGKVEITLQEWQEDGMHPDLFKIELEKDENIDIDFPIPRRAEYCLLVTSENITSIVNFKINLADG